MKPVTGNLLGILGICIWSLVPVLIIFCKGISLPLIVGGSCIANWLVFATEWKIAKRKLADMFQASPYSIFIVVAVMSTIRFLYWGGLQQINAIEAMIIHNLWVIFIVIGGGFILSKTISFKETSVLAIIAGSVVLMLSETGNLFGSANLWHLGIFFTAIVWALYVLYCQFSSMFSGSEPAVAGLIIGVLCIAYEIIFGSIMVDPFAWLAIILIGVFNRLGHKLWTIAMSKGTQSFEVISTYAMIIIGIAFVCLLGLAVIDLKLIIVTVLIISAGISVSAISDEPILKIKNA